MGKMPATEGSLLKAIKVAGNEAKNKAVNMNRIEYNIVFSFPIYNMNEKILHKN
jgi:hypothetical protein